MHQQAELDLLIFKGGKKLGFEIKYTDTPRVTRSMQKTLDLLELDQLHIVCPGDLSFPLGPKTQAIGLDTLTAALSQTAAIS